MTRADFVFTIGYQGNTAVVDKNARRIYANASATELLAAGLHKPAFCSALYDNDAPQMEAVVAAYRQKTGNPDITAESLKRLFGVFGDPGAVQKVLLV